MPFGKPAYTRCVQLDEKQHCLLFGKPERPEVCLSFRPEEALCGQSNEQAFVRLEALERATKPV